MSKFGWTTLGFILGIVVATLFFEFQDNVTSESITIPATTAPGIHSNMPKTVNLGSFSVAIDYAPYLVARATNQFEQKLAAFDVDITYTTFQSLAPINEAFATGQLDVVFEAEPPAIIGRASGIELESPAVSCSLIQEIIVPFGSEIKNLHSLAGHTIGVTSGTSSHYGVISNLEASGVNRTQVKIIDLTPPDARAAFRSDQIDSWAIWPPFVEQEIIDSKAKVLPGGNAKIHSIMVIRTDFRKKYPKISQALIDVVEESKAWIRANRQEAIEIVSNALSLSVEVVELAWPKHDFEAQIDQAMIEDIQEKAKFLAKEGLIKEEINVATTLFSPTS